MSRRIFLVLGIIVIVALQHRYWFGDSGHFREQALSAEVEDAQQRNDRLEQRNRVLAAEVRALKTGLDAVEARARTDLGMIGEGETYYLVVDEPPPSPAR